MRHDDGDGDDVPDGILLLRLLLTPPPKSLQLRLLVALPSEDCRMSSVVADGEGDGDDYYYMYK